jgi:hypothetical protein
LLKKLKILLDLMEKKNKEIKARRDAITEKIEAEYLARKKTYPREIPKFAKATKINLNADTYKQILVNNALMTQDEMNGIFSNE